MRRTSSKLTIWFAAAALAAGTPTALLARVKVNINFDKKFDFKPVRTWAWNPGEPGQIMMGRTAEDDPKAAQKLAEPIILQEVASELTKRGLTAATGQPDVTVTYYLLLTTSINAQTVGQFLPATLDWGLPPFPQATQSLKVMNAGSLVTRFQLQGRHRLARCRPGGDQNGRRPEEARGGAAGSDTGLVAPLPTEVTAPGRPPKAELVKEKSWSSHSRTGVLAYGRRAVVAMGRWS